MTNDETMFRPFVQRQSWLHFDHLPVHPPSHEPPSSGSCRTTARQGVRMAWAQIVSGDFFGQTWPTGFFTAKRMNSLAPLPTDRPLRISKQTGFATAEFARSKEIAMWPFH